jgi:hypothetical protein
MAGDDKSSLAAQLSVREALRRRFPRRPWMDVVTKVTHGAHIRIAWMCT